MFRFLIDIAFAVVVGLPLLFQVIIPLWNNQKTFPIFRKRPVVQLAEKINNVNEAIETEESKLELAEKQKQLEILKKQTSGK